ncbi:hypothetical protein [Micromonospora sp. WMMD980]|uniref:hypothetical protein n=1 Tax=Micromonospora sp. WMMD980 TaxID=3016088 RepID=UPI0024177516|nr:hypothetical protein [Micromonospora sp. WMMD980]MDG4799049.1 hypothetical protein [Micromonospora sp. WMMD980]
MAALTVDWSARTITGLALPYGPVGITEGRRWRYLRGTVRPAARVWLLHDHVQSRRAGRLVDVDDTEAGLWTAFRADRSGDGDLALAYADAGRHGLSAGVEVTATSWSGQPRVYVPTAAELTEVSLTERPVFVWS